MNRVRVAGYVIVVGVALYIAGILLPYARLHLPHAVAGPAPSTQDLTALTFFGPGAFWRAITPLGLMLVVSVFALALLWPVGSPALFGGATAGIGLELFLLFVGRVIATTYPPLGEAGTITAGPGAVLAPLGALLIAAGGLLAAPLRREPEPAEGVRIGPGIPSIVGSVVLIALATFNTPGRPSPSAIRLNTNPLHWTRYEFWLALSILFIVVAGLWLAFAAARGRESPPLIGLVVGLGVVGVFRYGGAMGLLATLPIFSPGPELYLGLAGSALLLVGAWLVAPGRPAAGPGPEKVVTASP